MNKESIITNNRYMVLGTINYTISPWVTPLAYTYRGGDFYFYSNKDSLHINNIETNPKVSAVIFNATAKSSQAIGLYFLGKAEVLMTVKAVEHAKAILFSDLNSQPTSDQFLEVGQLRIVQLQPDEFWVNDARFEKGLWYDFRREL